MYKFSAKVKYTLALVLYLIIGFININTAQIAQAFELSGGIAACNEGDDRWRPSVGVEAIFAEYYMYKSYIYGRTFTHIKEYTFINSFSYIFSLLNENFLANIGPSVLVEKTKIDGIITENSEPLDKTIYNLGVLLGLSYQIKLDPIRAKINWDSHLYTAGLASIFLVTGRKQLISLTVGLDL